MIFSSPSTSRSRRSRCPSQPRSRHALLSSFLSHPLISVNSFCVLFFYIFLSFWAYRIGYFLGILWRTPDVDNVFSPVTAWPTPYTPRGLRNLAWMMLWTSVAVIVTAALKLALLLKKEGVVEVAYGIANQENKLGALLQEKLSPAIGKFDFELPTNTHSVCSTSQMDDNIPPAGTLLARLGWAIVIFSFSLSFIKKQHCSSTLYYHPVNSPLLLLAESDPSSISKARDSYELNRDPELQLGLGVGYSTSNTASLSSFSSLTQLAEDLPGSKGLRYDNPVVPRIVHFVFGMDSTFGGKPFAYAHYLSIYSAMAENKPEKVMFWYHFSPATAEVPNWWFERIQQDAKAMGVVFELKLARPFDAIFGNPVTNFAHKADIIRIEALLEYGGIYVDLDVYTIRSFDPLLHFPTTLGLEGGTAGFPRQGLCNGIIVAMRNAPFLKKWYSSYRTFLDSEWAENSIRKPLELARQYPEELLVLDPTALFYPLWNNEGLRLVHSRQAEINGEGWDFDSSGQFAYHAWSSFADTKWLARMNPDKVFEIETSFNLLVRRWTSEELRRDWRLAKAKGLAV